MSRWHRTGLSLASALLAELLVGLAVSFPGSSSLFFERTFFFLWFATLLVLPGWLLALPVVLGLRRTDGWRLARLALLGSLVGPVLIGAIVLCLTLQMASTSRWGAGIWNFFYLATAISVLATALYLLSLRLLSRARPTSPPDDPLPDNSLPDDSLPDDPLPDNPLPDNSLRDDPLRDNH